MNGFQSLGNAIILRAVEDYRRARKKIMRGRRMVKAGMKEMDECLTFLRSEQAAQYTDLNLDEVIRRIDREESNDK